MSLIPSESYSFPDHFTNTVAGSRKPQEIEPEPEEEPIEPPRRQPTIVALPNPEPQPAPPPVVLKENPEPVRKVAPRVPNPALRRAIAPPPRISETPVRKIALPPTLKLKVRWNNRAPAIDPASAANNGNGNGNGVEHRPHAPLMSPAQNVIQMKPAPPIARQPREMPRIPAAPLPRPAPVASPPNPAAFAPPQKPVARPKPAQPSPVRENKRPIAPVNLKPAPTRPMVASNPQADFFEAFAQSGEGTVSKRRRKGKMRRFMICEGVAVGLLLPLAILGLSYRAENIALVWIMNIATIAAAVATALIPILFFALTPTLPEIER